MLSDILNIQDVIGDREVFKTDKKTIRYVEDPPLSVYLSLLYGGIRRRWTNKLEKECRSDPSENTYVELIKPTRHVQGFYP